MKIFQNDKLVATLFSNKMAFKVIQEGYIQTFKAIPMWILIPKGADFKESRMLCFEATLNEIINTINRFSDKFKIENFKSKILLVADNEREEEILGNLEYAFIFEPKQRALILYQDLEAIEKS